MELSIVIIFLYCAVFFVAALMLSFLYRLRQILGYRALIVAVIGHCILSASSLAVYALDDMELKILFSRLRFLGLSVLAPSILLFVSSLYQRWTWLDTWWAKAILFGPAALTWIFTLTPPLRDLVVTDFRPIRVGHYNVLEFNQGHWFAWHVVSSYICSITMLAFAIHSFWKMRGTKRRQIGLIWFSCFLVSIVDAYCIATDSKWRWAMLSGAVFILADIAILYAGLKHHLFENIPYATEKIFQSLSDPILVINSDQTLETANSAALEVLGISKRNFGRLISDVYPLPLDGTDITIKGDHFEVVHEPILGGKNALKGRIIYLRKITTHKEAENLLNAHLEFKSIMLSLISHDVVGNIQAQTSLMRNIQDGKSRDPRIVMETLTNSHDSLNEFLTNILNWEKSQSQQFSITKSPFDVKVFIKDCCEQVALSASIKGVNFDKRFELKNEVIEADSEILAASLRNLLSNAVKAAPTGSSIIVSASVSQSELKIEVIDSGKGLSADRLTVILNSSLFSFKKNASTGGGFGIGLFITRHFIQMHQGEFWISSELGRGTVAGFSVPI